MLILNLPILLIQHQVFHLLKNFLMNFYSQLYVPVIFYQYLGQEWIINSCCCIHRWYRYLELHQVLSLCVRVFHNLFSSSWNDFDSMINYSYVSVFSFSSNYGKIHILHQLMSPWSCNGMFIDIIKTSLQPLLNLLKG